MDVPERFSMFIENGIPMSTVFRSTLNYLYAILPNYLHSSTEVNRREIFQNALAVAGRLATNNDNKQGIDSLNKLIDDNRIPEALDILMSLGASPNSADSYGNTALYYATLLPFHGLSQDCVILNTVRRHGIRMNIRNQEKETPLHYCLSEQTWKLASEKGTWNGIITAVEICEFLLNDGSLIDETTRFGETVYHLIMNLFQKGLSVDDKNIRDTICFNAAELLNLFSKTTGKRFNLLKKTDDKQNSPLHLWASLSLPANQTYADHITKEINCQMLLETIFKHLWKPGISPNPMNENDQMPLHLCKTWTAARLLIEAGAKKNSLDRDGAPPLLNAAKQNTFKINPGHFFPDVKGDPKQFFETCVSLGLDIWCSDNEGKSILSIFLDSEEYTLSKALIDVVVTSCDSTSIVKQLVDAVCKDGSTNTTWKSGLTIELLTSSNPSCKINLDDALRHICTNIKKLLLQGQDVGIDKVNESDEPPNKISKIDDTDEEIPSNLNVFVDIGRQLLFYGADGNSLCNDFPALRSFLTATISPDQMKKIIPWTSHSTTHEDKLKVVSRKQNVEEIGTYCYHKEPIGHGGFGEVFAGICKNDAREVAIKKINRSLVKGPQDKREINILLELSDCQQVVKYISFDGSDNDFVYIVLELMEGHLDNYFESSSFDASRRGGICRDAVQGLKYLHQHRPEPILHRDLKPENILYKFDTHGKLIIKIADFGLSSPLTTGRTTVIHSKAGTRCWMAPEVLTSKTYEHSTSSDVFSCGLVCHYILSKKKHPFGPADCTNKSDEAIAHATQDNMLRYQMDGWDHDLSPEATHLIKGMLEKDSSQRPSAADSLRHPFFWSNKKKMDFLSTIGNQYEFECPSTSKAACYHVTTGVEAHLENNFTNIVRYGKWDDPNYKDMANVVAEMNNPIPKINKKGATYFQTPRTYDTVSVIELVRFTRNAINHVSEQNRKSDIRKLILEKFVFLKEFPHLLMEVYKAVTTYGWDTREEIKYAMTHEEHHP